MKNYNLPKISSKELLEIFPEAKKIIPVKIRELKLEIKAKKRLVKEKLKILYAHKLDDFSIWFGEEYINQFLILDLIDINRNINRLERLQSEWFKTKCPFKISDADIERAKNNPIVEIASEMLELRKVGNRFRSLCPFHKEKTPSFYIFPETNTYHCFGCQKHGDVINFTQNIFNIEFKDAIKKLI